MGLWRCDPAAEGAARDSLGTAWWGTGFAALATAAVLVAGAAAGVAAPIPGPSYRDGPPPGFSGGFGEQSCDACHFPGPMNDPSGSLLIEGVPAGYAAGETYQMSIVLRRPGMVLGGFQLAARYAGDGAQAGSLAPAEDEAERLAVAVDRGIQYVFQRELGARPDEKDTARWVVRWTAPNSTAGGRVSFSVAANAADGDDTTSGDFVYVAEAGVEPKTE